eukprot:IDg2742t1
MSVYDHCRTEKTIQLIAWSAFLGARLRYQVSSASECAEERMSRCTTARVVGALRSSSLDLVPFVAFRFAE